MGDRATLGLLLALVLCTACGWAVKYLGDHGYQDDLLRALGYRVVRPARRPKLCRVPRPPSSSLLVPRPRVQQLAAHAANVIAITATPSNEDVAYCTLAKLYLAKKVGQTDAIRYGLGIAPSGTNPAYQEAVRRFQATVKALQPAPQVREPDGTKQPLTRPITRTT